MLIGVKVELLVPKSAKVLICKGIEATLVHHFETSIHVLNFVGDTAFCVYECDSRTWCRQGHLDSIHWRAATCVNRTSNICDIRAEENLALLWKTLIKMQRTPLVYAGNVCFTTTTLSDLGLASSFNQYQMPFLSRRKCFAVANITYFGSWQQSRTQSL